MIPEGWEREHLGDLFDFKNGLNGEKELYGSGVKFANVMDVFRGPRLRQFEIIGSMQATEKQLREFGLKFGDVLFNRTSETEDEIALATVYFGDESSVFGGFVIRARPKTERICADFNVYAFQSPSMRREMIRLGQGAIRANIGQSDLATVPILIPPLPEQRRIAEILSTWDRAIETVEALIANARAQKQALMHSLLTGKKRLPGFLGEWIQTPIAKMGTIVSGGTPDSTDATCWGGDIAWATPTDITKLHTRHISQTERYITPLGLSSSSAKRLPVGTVIVCTRATVGALAIATVPMTTNQGFKNIVPNGKHDSDFIYFLMSQNKKALIRAAGGSTFAEVSKADFEKLTFSVPPLDEQQAIAAVLICADTAFEKLESKLTALREEKSALMQQLLTGKQRVKVDLEGEPC
jgi:type I restriction enzyme, S subunit